MLKIKFFGCIFRIRKIFTLLSEFSKFLPNAFCVLETTRRLTYYALSLKTPGIVIFNTVRCGRMRLIYALLHFIGEETVVERLNNLLEIVQVISDKTRLKIFTILSLTEWLSWSHLVTHSSVIPSVFFFLPPYFFLPSFPLLMFFWLSFQNWLILEVIFVKHLLCVRHCVNCWGCNNRKDRHGYCPHRT